jgi:hypothetical protein
MYPLMRTLRRLAFKSFIKLSNMSCLSRYTLFVFKSASTGGIKVERLSFFKMN